MVDSSKPGLFMSGGSEIDRISMEMEMDEKGLMGGLLFGGSGDGVLCEVWRVWSQTGQVRAWGANAGLRH